MGATTPRDKNKTRQDYETPDEFFDLVNKYLPCSWDLAANRHNSKCHNYIDESSDSITRPWHELDPHKFLWLNPPFKNIAPWALKCLGESGLGANIVMLTPASVGSNWFKEICFQKCFILFLNGRLTFKGEKLPYPKDCMLTIWSRSFPPDVRIWEWKKEAMFKGKGDL